MEKSRLIFILVFIGLIGFVIGYPILASDIEGDLLEDSGFTYNFTQNVSGSISGDLIFDIFSISSDSHASESADDYPWISINSSTGVMLLNSSRDNETGYFNISVSVVDSTDQGTTIASFWNVTAVNDAPLFSNLGNLSWDEDDSVINYEIIASDEEEDYALNFSVDFISCELAGWSSRRNGTPTPTDDNCTLFSYSQSGNNTLLLNVSTDNDFVGNYTINFTVNDSRGAETTEQVIFSINNTNDPPVFNYVCDNERNATEDSAFSCWINVSDEDELNDLTFVSFVSDTSWFKFNNSDTSIDITANEQNASALVEFTPTDIAVGNWSITINVTDSDSEDPRTNSTSFWFFVNNTEDVVSLDSISDKTIYENQTYYVNASDDDLLIKNSQHLFKNEVLTFNSNTSWVEVTKLSYVEGRDYITGQIDVNYDYAYDNLGAGNYSVKINVTDIGDNSDEQIFTIEIVGDNAAEWNDTSYTFVYNEDEAIYINLSDYVTDIDGDELSFSWSNTTSFDSFSLSSSGIIDFTPIDVDVGEHILNINASDGKLDSIVEFNFTINNVNDNPDLETPITVSNASRDVNSNINATEDNYTIITLWIEDNDFLIPSGQSSFYEESISVDLTIEGVNDNLFSFTQDDDFPSQAFPNKTKFTAVFTPSKSDVGDYNITINVSDLTGASESLEFNLTVNSINHAPVLDDLTNQSIGIEESFSYQISATDTEDGTSGVGNDNFTFSYEMLQGDDVFNSTTFNSSTGLISLVFNSTQGGRYHLNVSVNDSEGLEDSGDFWIYVYDKPIIISPSSGTSYSWQENETESITFNLNHSVGDYLQYEVYLDGVLRDNFSYYGNASDYTWNFTPNYSDETYSGNVYLTLKAYPANYSSGADFWNSSDYVVSISHANAPVEFSGHIGESQATYNQDIEIDLTTYFSDYDHFDSNYNQTVAFSISSNATPSYISYSVDDDWLLTLSSLIAVSEVLTINATDLHSTTNISMTSDTSNAFQVTFTEPATQTVEVPSSGGGSTRYRSIKIIVPSEVVVFENSYIDVPFQIENDGQVAVSSIELDSLIKFNDVVDDGVDIEFDVNEISRLYSGDSVNNSMRIYANTNKVGRYLTTIFANVSSPDFSESANFYIDLRKTNQTEAEKVLVFTEKLISENPECLELTELVNEADELMQQGDYTASVEKANEAVAACEDAISSNEQIKTRLNLAENSFYYVSFATLFVFFIGFVFFLYKRVRFNKAKVNDYIG